MSNLFSFFPSTVDEPISKDCDLRLGNIWLLSLVLSLLLNRESLLQGAFMMLMLRGIPLAGLVCCAPSAPDPMFLPVLLQHCPALHVFMI